MPFGNIADSAAAETKELVQLASQISGPLRDQVSQIWAR
jgi:hypothetical protein